MNSNAEEGPGILFQMEKKKRSAEKQNVVKHSSRTETTQLSLRNEPSGNQREERYDETAVFADAKAIKPLA